MAKKKAKRSDDLTSRFEGDDDTTLLDIYTAVEKGFENQRDRSDAILDNWDMYNCQLGEKQFYNGTSQLAMPFVRDAIEARVTRFANQVFPQSGRYVEVTTGEADPPQATQALIESYVRKCKLRTQVVPALLRNGDVEGQYSVYVSWIERQRTAQFRVKKQPKTDGEDNVAAEPVDDIQEEEITDAFPDVEVVSDPDLLVLPATSVSIEAALDDGGSVTVLRRWSKGKIKKLIKDGDIPKDAGEDLLEEMQKVSAKSKDPDVAKDQLDAAGIKERGKVAIVFETWTKLEVDKERRLCRVYFAGEDQILGVKLNPFWNDRCPVISAPVIKVTGAFKGKAPVDAVADLAILANDTINEAADSSHFSAMPIVMTDPIGNPRVDTMTLGMGAIWEVDPNKTKMVTFPELWKDGLDRTLAIKDQIFQTLGVNPSMIPNQTGGPAKKRSQAEMAIEQQVDLLTTADAVTILEEGQLTPIVQRFAEYDHQFRDEETTVRVYGPMGENANMEKVEPIQLNERFEFRWYGVEVARNAAMMQQQIAGVNVIKGLGPQSYPDYDLDLAPLVVQMTENLFGPRLAPQVFKKKTLITVDPIQENHMIMDGFLVPTHLGDDDVVHMAAHSALLQDEDPVVQAKAKEHMMKHQIQMMTKAGGGPGGQQGGGQAPGGGGPSPGGQPSLPHAAKQPPGAVHKDAMGASGATPMPRKAA